MSAERGGVVAEGTEMEEEKAFAHLQELVDELPAMQELGERARLAHAAAEVARATHALEATRKTCAHCDAELAEARRRLGDAESADDAAQADHLRREVLFLADRLALAKGPVNDAEFRLGKLLKREGLASVEDALAHALDPAALTSLDARIASYQQDYRETYALCQRLGDAQG